MLHSGKNYEKLNESSEDSGVSEWVGGLGMQEVGWLLKVAGSLELLIFLVCDDLKGNMLGRVTWDQVSQMSRTYS